MKPWRKVVACRFAYRPMGYRSGWLCTLECGHKVFRYASNREPVRLKCDQCEAGKPAADTAVADAAATPENLKGGK